MAIGGVSQPLYIRGLPPGVGMLITDVQFNIPNFGSWTPSLQNIPGGYNIGKKTTPAQKNDIFPIPINTTYRNGYIGLAHLSSSSHRDSGLGPEIYIEFNLTGTATLADQPPLRVKGREAFITVATDDWGSWARPDFSIVSYYLPGVPAKTLLNKVPAWQSPKDVSFVVAVSPKKRVVGMNASVEPNVVKDLVEWALKGIFFAHEKAVGWVVGKPV